MSYWQEREELEYYQIVRRWLSDMGPLESILDVGCFDTPVATWGDFEKRITVDPSPRPALSGVLQIVGYWPDCTPLVPICDIVTCLQVLEHLDNPMEFCGALFTHSRLAVILSVPWGWEEGSCKYHKQDPVNADKLRSWTGRDPDQEKIVGTPARMVAMYRGKPKLYPQS